MSRPYEVAIGYRGLNHYIVEADSADQAEDLARSRWEDGDDGEALGNEFVDIEHITVTEVPDE